MTITAATLGAVTRLTVVAMITLTACAVPGSNQAARTSSTRPATKSTCPEAVLTSGTAPLDRKLVPYSDQLLAVETLWGDDDVRLRIVSGGYLDDVLEAYDDLEEFDRTTIRDTEAVLLRSSLLDVPVRVAVWREDTPAPCDAHALIVTGLEDPEFRRQLETIR